MTKRTSATCAELLIYFYVNHHPDYEEPSTAKKKFYCFIDHILSIKVLKEERDGCLWVDRYVVDISDAYSRRLSTYLSQ